MSKNIELSSFFLDFLFPKKCLGCNEKGKYFCENCLKKVRKASRNSSNQIVTVWKYEGVIKKGITYLKYKYAHSISEELVDNYLKYLDKTKLPDRAVLIPVPMHIQKKRQRGFNQTEVLGRIVAKKLHWEYEENLVKKVKNTKPQVGLAKKERIKNVKGSFEVNKKLMKELKNKKLVIFDDVYTTGATIGEMVQTINDNTDSIIIVVATIARG